jgi:hypothetical protein
VNSLRYLAIALCCSALTGYSRTIVIDQVNDARSDVDNGRIEQSFELQPGKSLSTGPHGRIQLRYSGGIVRMGGDSALRCGTDGLTLEHGTFMFHGVGPNERLNVASPDGEVSISGETAFVRVERSEPAKSPVVVIGGLAGKVQVKCAGKIHAVRPSDLFVLSGSSVDRDHFNLPKLVKSSRLLNGFQSGMPNSSRVAASQADFEALNRRGFVRTHDDQMDEHNKKGATMAAAREHMGATGPVSTAGLAGSSTGVTVLSREGVFLGPSNDNFGLVLLNSPHSPHRPPPKPPEPHGSHGGDGAHGH